MFRLTQRHRSEPMERPRTEPLPDGHTVVVEGHASILTLLTRDSGDCPTQPLPMVVSSAAPPPAASQAPLLTLGARWRTRGNRHPGWSRFRRSPGGRG